MTLKDKLEEALITEEKFCFSTPTYEYFLQIITLLKEILIIGKSIGRIMKRIHIYFLKKKHLNMDQMKV